MASPRRGATERALIRGQRAMAASTGIVLVTSRRLQPGGLDPLEGGPREDPVDGGGVGPPGALAAQRRLGLDEGPGRVDDVVQDQDVLALDLADDVQDLGLVLAGAPLVDDRERRVRAAWRSPGRASTPPTSGETITRSSRSSLRIASRITGAAKRWSTGMLKKPWICAAWRSIVRIRSAPGGRQQVRHELGRDRNAGLVLLVLPRVAEVRQHRRDPRRRGAPEGVEQDQQLHHVVVDRASTSAGRRTRPRRARSRRSGSSPRRPRSCRASAPRAGSRGTRRSPGRAPDARGPRRS